MVGALILLTHLPVIVITLVPSLTHPLLVLVPLLTHRRRRRFSLFTATMLQSCSLRWCFTLLRACPRGDFTLLHWNSHSPSNDKTRQERCGY
ncbi:hypothetical protein AAZV13_01G084900 [Glycine max]